AMGPGLFAGAALERFGERAAFVDEAGLNEPDARAGFLTRIFALAAFREARESGRAERLTHYHAENKLLFLAYDQETMREMGRVAANHEKYSFGEVASSYESALLRLLARTPGQASWVNALTHAVGHLSEKITKSDKARFLATLEEYREGRIPLDEPLDMLRDWTARFGSEYLEKQTIFEPYPHELREESDR
ncbi:MAG: YbgA family protein, partial [Nitrospinae bacterium]|nr:YbgA family protein [Nitrospinota bacterium]